MKDLALSRNLSKDVLNDAAVVSIEKKRSSIRICRTKIVQVCIVFLHPIIHRYLSKEGLEEAIAVLYLTAIFASVTTHCKGCFAAFAGMCGTSHNRLKSSLQAIVTVPANSEHCHLFQCFFLLRSQWTRQQPANIFKIFSVRSTQVVHSSYRLEYTLKVASELRMDSPPTVAADKDRCETFDRHSHQALASFNSPPWNPRRNGYSLLRFIW